jgi:hypothetical protein
MFLIILKLYTYFNINELKKLLVYLLILVKFLYLIEIHYNKAVGILVDSFIVPTYYLISQSSCQFI